MRDAFGGLLSIIIIAIFLVIVEGILGLVVNYTKAFRMKNAVISNIERYEGLGCFQAGDTDCHSKIRESAKSIGYAPLNELHCPNDSEYVKMDDIYCVKQSNSQSGNNYVYSIITQVDINIPIINKIMGLSFFQVHGDTRAIRKYDGNQVQPE